MIRRIPLDTPITEGPSNAYLLDGDPLALVDTGIGTARAKRQLEDALAGYGVSFSDVDRVFLTHYHADHGGLAGEIQEAGGATVLAHRADGDRVAFSESGWLEICEPQYDHLVRWGVPEAKLRELRAVNDESYRLYSESAEVDAVADGETFAAGETELEVVHTPGHTMGSCCFLAGDEATFTGDTLLPVYTPNIGGVDMRLDDPLGCYLASLARLDDRLRGGVLPGHREAVLDPYDRLREIARHHEQQARQILAIIEAAGRACVWSVASALFDALEGIHVMLGTGETHAHLENMRRLGLVARRPEGYALSGGTAASLGDRLRDHWPLLER